MHYATGRAFVAIIGGGLKWALSHRVGVQVDVRAAMGPNTMATRVDAKPNTTIGTPQGYISTLTSPSIQFSGNANVKSSLSGPALTGFETFTGTGVQMRLSANGGVFFRF